MMITLAIENSEVEGGKKEENLPLELVAVVEAGAKVIVLIEEELEMVLEVEFMVNNANKMRIILVKEINIRGTK